MMTKGYMLCFFITLLFSDIKSEKYKGTHLSTIFEDNLIVPHLLPNNPEELCTIIYEPNLIISTAQPYYVYQIQGLPEIEWDSKSEKYYTVVVLGAIQKEVQRPTTVSVLENDTNYTLQCPVQWWHHWVIVDVRKNDLKTGTIIQPFTVNSNVPQPNDTHKLVFAFAVYEQPKKLKLQVDDNENSPKALLERYFTPLSKYVESFKETVLIAGNYFYAVFKPQGLVLDSSPVRNLLMKAIKNRMVI
ncbi:putative odorant-binding protein A5 [Planococcus citri]|uniref:putative odorant-binding protein A5 n=1 Tax=Planococcus citri TaxID=170843 RepID=UPI0031F881D2